MQLQHVVFWKKKGKNGQKTKWMSIVNSKFNNFSFSTFVSTRLNLSYRPQKIQIKYLIKVHQIHQ